MAQRFLPACGRVTHDSSIAGRAPRLVTIEAGQITLTEQQSSNRSRGSMT
ncbi:hypothetical protein ABT187_01685 [Streptomyces sp. NPDC001817]